MCALCAAKGGGCCRNTRVFLTRGDVERVERAVGEKDFWERLDVRVDAHATGLMHDPAWERIFSGQGGWRALRHVSGTGDCRFLTTGGCSLPVEARPLICRLYPFDYNDVAIKGVYGHLCPEPFRDNPALLLAMLGMGREEAERLRAKLYRELAAEFPP